MARFPQHRFRQHRLNLQNASVVINCDLPWNPARLEQRIARAWRKHQTRSVTVIHLVSKNTIEHRMLGTLASKQALSDGVLDLRGDLTQIKLGAGREAFLNRLQQIMATPPSVTAEALKPKPLPADRSLAFSQRVREIVNGAFARQRRFAGRIARISAWRDPFRRPGHCRGKASDRTIRTQGADPPARCHRVGNRLARHPGFHLGTVRLLVDCATNVI